MLKSNVFPKFKAGRLNVPKVLFRNCKVKRKFILNGYKVIAKKEMQNWKKSLLILSE